MRAENRHHRQRKIKSTEQWAKRYQCNIHPYPSWYGRSEPTHEELSKEIRKRAITPKPCSSGEHGCNVSPRRRGEGDPYRDKKKGNEMEEK